MMTSATITSSSLMRLAPAAGALTCSAIGWSPLPAPASDGRLRLLLARNHHLRRFDDGHGIVAPFQLQLLERVAGNDRGQRLIADPQPDLPEEAVNAHFVD